MDKPTETAIKQISKDNWDNHKKIKQLMAIIENQEKRIIWCEENLKIKR